MITTNLSLILPAYNEEENIQPVTEKALAALRALVPCFEILLVNDGSSDQTGAMCTELAARYPEEIRVYHHQTNRGYGAALRTGFAYAQYPLLCYTDADDQFDLQEIASFLPYLTEYDVVIGFRLWRQDPLFRRWTSRIFNWLAKALFHLQVHDINCAFKLFKRTVLTQFTLEADDFFINTEFLAKVHQLHIPLYQLAVCHYPRTRGHTKVRLGDVWSTLYSFWTLRRTLQKEQQQIGEISPILTGVKHDSAM